MPNDLEAIERDVTATNQLEWRNHGFDDVIEEQALFEKVIDHCTSLVAELRELRAETQTAEARGYERGVREAAGILKTWHYKKGGYGQIEDAIRALLPGERS